MVKPGLSDARCCFSEECLINLEAAPTQPD